MFDNPFGLSEDEYWTSPWKNCSELLQRYVFNRNFGLYIDAPPRVDLNDHDSIPLLVLYAAMEKDRAQLVFGDMAKLVISDVHRREVTVTKAVEPSEHPAGPRPFDRNSTAGISEIYNTNLASHGGIREPGEYVATVLLRERTSNRVRVTVSKPHIGYQDPKVLEFLEQQRRAAPPLRPGAARPSERAPYPTYRATPSSPPVPVDPGVSAAVERVIVSRREARCVLSGSFRLPVFESDRIPPRDESLREPNYGDPRPTAIIPITAVVVGTTDISQKLLRMRVPSWDALEQGDAPLVTGHFAVDLFEDDIIDPLVAQTNFIYLFSGEHMSGPHTAAVVTENMLPRKDP
jgi:hypothetical protein